MASQATQPLTLSLFPPPPPQIIAPACGEGLAEEHHWKGKPLKPTMCWEQKGNLEQSLQVQIHRVMEGIRASSDQNIVSLVLKVPIHYS